MRCFYVTKNDPDSDQSSRFQITDRPESELPDADTLVNVHWTALNYKDALAATGHPGVVRRFPHVPGIDAVGEVAATESPLISVGQPVLVTSYGLGSDRWGGWSERIRVPSAWLVPLPPGLSPREAAILGTAGLTAGLSLDSLQSHGVLPDRGPLVVTGATGGVGILATQLLVQSGYQVAAVTGKAEWHEKLRKLGVVQVLTREEFINTSTRPLLTARWAGAVDTVGGATLSTLLRETIPEGCVAACGLVGGAELTTSIYPFLLRGITLAGIDSANLPMARRLEQWRKLASEWKPPSAFLHSIAIETDLESLPQYVERILAGQIAGRVIVRIS